MPGGLQLVRQSEPIPSHISPILRISVENYQNTAHKASYTEIHLSIPTRPRGPQIRAWHEIVSFSDMNLTMTTCILGAFRGHGFSNFVPGTNGSGSAPRSGLAAKPSRPCVLGGTGSLELITSRFVGKNQISTLRM
jgi:hypothetical protein